MGYMTFVLARNTETGLIGKVSARIIGHPVLGKNYVLADENAKDYLPELYKPQTAEEFTLNHPPREENDEDDFDDEDGE